MTVSRISPLPHYSGSQNPIQIDDSSQYSESPTPGLSPETGLLAARSTKDFKFPPAFGLRSMNPDSNKVRVLKAPRLRRRPKATKANKIADFRLTGPLSQVTQHLTHVPLKDMEAWINRPAEERRREAAKRGKVTRPMNSFMLYRSAYSERTKKLCSQSNHQIVSCISGQSWALEPPEIKEQYELLALVERDKHHKAHPDYKFTPNKAQMRPRKKRRAKDEGSEADETGYQLGPHRSPNPHKHMKTGVFKNEYGSRESTPYDQDPLFPDSVHNRWPMTLGQRLPTRLMAPHEQQQQQQHHHHHHHHGGYYMNAHGPYPGMIRSSDDAHTAARPTGYVINNGYSASTSLASIPGNINQELLRSYSSASSASTTVNANGGNNNHSNGATMPRMDDSQLDPQLLASQQAGLDLRSYNQVNMSTMWPQHDQDLSSYMPMSGPIGNNGVSYDSLNANYTMQPLEEGQQVWAQCGEDEGIGGSEVIGKDFDQWIHNQNHHQPVYGGPQ
ncbi:HMG box protein, putative [Talaromyces stipitatus ATCC 10500]|uniref:HMG box protein, putative n=1 Tax=Talaromyces stipitatus (strain ATCC 10500 / CBS 375.48 / QM 6759 / NRRL 1006) TaxID=441959 RepID=B8LWI7_TALSN|nr:HMG box protein, putative [Talaromyces stipitatus ATCC 10500]EED24298.1 HMG box protein, putative [Talaromyces stipitatus ATCC 10500]